MATHGRTKPGPLGFVRDFAYNLGYISGSLVVWNTSSPEAQRALTEDHMRRILLAAALGVALIAQPGLAQTSPTKTFPLPNQTFIHDVAPAPGGLIWWTAQSDGKLGILDPKTGANKFVTLGPDSAPHGIIQSKDGKAWITDGGQNAIVSYDPKTEKVTVYKLPEETGGYTNLNTPTEDGDGNIWFTGQNGWHGKVDVKTGKVSAWKSPKGRGSYGMTTTPDGNVWFVSFANSYLGQVDRATGNVKVIEPPSRTRACAAYGATARAISGCRSGTAVRFRTIRRRPESGSAFRFQATSAPLSTPSMSTTGTSSG